MSALGIRTVLAATDLTDAMYPALRSAARLAELTDAQLHVLHTSEKDAAEADLHEHLRAAGLPGTAAANARVVTGLPGAVIIQEATRLQADVIVLGPHQPGRSGLGSTAYHVVRDTQTPCLMLPVPLTLPLRRVLSPLDLSAPARGAFAVALTWTLALRQRGDGAAATQLDTLFVTPEDAADGSAESAHALGAEIDAVCRAFGVCAGITVNRKIDQGAPAAVILDTAEREAVDLIVIGTRGHRVEEGSLGSVSQDVVTRAQQPVLLVPPGVWQDQP